MINQFHRFIINLLINLFILFIFIVLDSVIGTGIQKPLYYFEIDLNFFLFFNYFYCEVRLV